MKFWCEAPIVNFRRILGFKMETEEPVSKNAITGIGLAYASEILTVVSEVGDIRQDCDTIHQVSISMLLSRHFDGGTSSKVKYCLCRTLGTMWESLGLGFPGVLHIHLHQTGLLILHFSVQP
ncbi:hypothetical protein Tco_0489271 [Tanacetum coccineum]